MSKAINVTVIRLEKEDVSQIDHTYNNPIDIFEAAFNTHFGKPVVFNTDEQNFEDDNSVMYLIYMTHREMTGAERYLAWEQYHAKCTWCDSHHKEYPRVMKIKVRSTK